MLQSGMSDDKSRLVYSTDKVIPLKEKPLSKIQHATTHVSQKRVTVRLDRKGRGGKSVTLIEGLHMSVKDQESLLKQFKAQLGTGGTLKNNTLEIQGDHRDAIMTILQDMGYKPKRSGG
jgi:translation initiation factor 1